MPPLPFPLKATFGMKRVLHMALIAVLLSGVASGDSITSIGNWTQTINASHLVAGAGSNLQSSLASISGTTTIDVNGAQNWTVLARRGTGPWSSGVTLQIKRTSAGSGAGTISGGEDFIDINTSNVTIFSGRSHRNGVALQYRLTGLSCTVPPGTYSAPIIFTVQ